MDFTEFLYEEYEMREKQKRKKIPMSVIDDIKAEIEQIVNEEADDEKWSRGLHYALKIIDKHIKESSDANSN